MQSDNFMAMLGVGGDCGHNTMVEVGGGSMRNGGGIVLVRKGMIVVISPECAIVKSKVR